MCLCIFWLRIQFIDKPGHSKSERALRDLETIDDEADELGIAFVKISDDELAAEYNLDVPSLVYFRHQVPIVHAGDLTKEDEVLRWLVDQKVSTSKYYSPIYFRSHSKVSKAAQNLKNIS